MEMHERFLTPEEVLMIVATGTRPICFSASPDDYIWGFGSSFLLNYKGNVFAITAKHVIENPKADCRHTRILMPNTGMALPIKRAFTPSFDDPENKDEVDDFILFEIDDALFTQESNKDLYSWNFERWSFPASKVPIGVEILVAGFPFSNDRYDWDNNKINELMLIRTGNLAKSSLCEGLYTMEGIPSETDFNGLSGSPIFCRNKGYVFFIGLVTRGTASSGKLHFIGSEFIRSALTFIK